MGYIESKIRAVIIDDEPGCVSNLKYYLAQYCPGIEVIAVANTTDDMVNIFKTMSFDIAFLDIEIFDESIFEVLNSVGHINCEVVFVTAHERYAIKAFKVDALDYILKPLLQTDIIECYQRIMKRFEEKHSNTHEGVQLADDKMQPLKKIVIKTGEHVFVIKQEDIIYLKAKGFYTQILFDMQGKETSTLISKPIGTLEKEYDNHLFFRVHKSYLLNIKKVKGIIKNGVTSAKISDEQIIPIAKRRVNEFLSALNQV